MEKTELQKDENSIVIRTTDLHAFTQEYYEVILNNIRSNLNLETIFFILYTNHNQVKKKENSDLYFMYRYIFSVNLNKARLKSNNTNDLARYVFKKVLKWYKKNIYIH